MSLRLQHPWWYLSLLAGVGVGLAGMGVIVLFGHAHELNRAWELPWGLLVAAAHFFALGSAGLCLAVPLLLPPDWPERSEVTQKTFLLAGLLLLMALGMLGIELSQPLRFAFAPAFGERLVPSLLLVGGMVLLYLQLLAATAWTLARGNRQLAVVCGVSGFLTALYGIFRGDDLLRYFGHGAAWFSAPVLLINIFTALLLGTALLLLLLLLPSWLERRQVQGRTALLVERLRFYLLLAIVMFATLQFLTMAIELAWGSDPARVLVRSLLWGELSLNCWGCEYLLGLVVPFLLLLSRRLQVGRLLLAAGLFLVGHLVFRYDLLMSAQLNELFRGQSWAVNPGLIMLSPCLPKLAVVIGSASLFLLLGSLNEKLLPFGVSQ